MFSSILHSGELALIALSGGASRLSYGGSFRMPVCDKVAKVQWRRCPREERPILPAQVLRFDFNDEDGSVLQTVLHEAEDLNKVQWLRRASVRLCHSDDCNAPVPITPWVNTFPLRVQVG